MMAQPFKGSSLTDHSHCHQILKGTKLEYNLHDCQVECVCQNLDGINLLAIAPTGSGKTGYYAIYVLVVAVVENPLLCPTSKFLKNPCLTVICPTIHPN
jgi:hypothetical protein